MQAIFHVEKLIDPASGVAEYRARYAGDFDGQGIPLPQTLTGRGESPWDAIANLCIDIEDEDEHGVVEMEGIREVCGEYLKYIESDEFHADGAGDYKNAIFEAAMEAVFGPDIWMRVNIALSGGVRYRGGIAHG